MKVFGRMYMIKINHLCKLTSNCSLLLDWKLFYRKWLEENTKMGLQKENKLKLFHTFI